MKTAVIVAAGLSSRLYPLTETTPKCLLPITNEKILERNLRLLKANGIENIFIVTEYLKHMIEEVAGEMATTIYNPYFKYCNNMGSLYCMKNLLQETPFIYLHGDVVYSEKLLPTFLQGMESSNAIDLAIDFNEVDEEAMKVRINANNELIESNKEISLTESAGEWIGLAAIHKPYTVFNYIEEALVDEKLTVYDTYAFTNMARDGHKIKCHSIQGEPWSEIDFIKDYEKAKELFAHESI